MKRKIMVVLVLALVALNAWGADYPTKPITVLQGFAPGGGSDVLAQATQPYLEKILGKSFVNQYIPGATGGIAWTQLARTASKDGYTISITNTPMLMTNYIMNADFKYNIKDFEPIANVVKESRYKTAEQFIAAAKANPGKITVGNSGVGGDDFFTTLIMEKASGLKFQMVPFSGDGPSWQAAMGNKIDASFNNLGITYPQIAAGNLRPLLLFAEKRDPSIPNVPTAKEFGFNVVSGSSRGYSAPKGIPVEAKNKLIAAFVEMSKDPAFLKGLADRALPIDFKVGDEYRKYLEENERNFNVIWDEVKGQYTAK